MEFTGGNDLEGYEAFIHKIMMKNELGKSDAYKLSDAKLARSGYSFGANQMDLSKNNHAQVVLQDILYHQQVDTNTISSIMTTVRQEGGKLSPDHFNLINTALSSEYGVEKINQAYHVEIKAGIKLVDDRLESSDPLVKGIAANSPYIKALLFDYHNQFYIEDHGQMHKFLSGEEITTYDKLPIKLNFDELNEESLVKQILNFTEHTKYFLESCAEREKRQSSLNNRHDAVKNLTQIYQMDNAQKNIEKLASENNNGNRSGNGKAILPTSAKMTSKEIDKLSEDAVKGNNITVIQLEYTNIQNNNTKSSSWAAINAVIDYGRQVKSYGFGLSQSLKNASAECENLLHQYNDPNHPEVVAAQERLNDLIKERDDFQTRTDEARVWGEFIVGMGSHFARLCGDEKQADKIQFYGGAIISAGLSAAQLYAGDPRGAVGLFSAITSLSSKPTASDEQKLLSRILGEISEIRKDLGDIKEGIKTINDNIQYIYRTLRSELVDFSRQLKLITQIGLDILSETKKIEGDIQCLMIDTLLIGFALLESKIKERRGKLEDDENISVDAAEEINNKIRDYMGSAKSIFALAAEYDITNIESFNKIILQRAKLEDSEDVVSGLLNSISPLLTYSRRLAQNRFSLIAGEVAVQKVTEGVVNLPMWKYGAQTIVLFLQRMQEQKILDGFLDKIGWQPFCNQLNRYIEDAQYTLNQLRFLAYSNTLDRLFEELNRVFQDIISSYKNHNYMADDANGLGKFIGEAKTSGNSLINNMIAELTVAPRSEITAYGDRAWLGTHEFPCKLDFPADKVLSKSFPKSTKYYRDKIEPFDFLVPDNNYRALPEFKCSHTNAREANFHEEWIHNAQYDDIRYLDGYSCKINFGHYETTEVRRGHSGHRPDGPSDSDFVTTVKNDGYVDLEVKILYVHKNDWYDALLNKKGKVFKDFEKHIFKDANNQDRLPIIFNQVSDINRKFAELENYKFLIRALVELFANEEGKKSTEELLNRYCGKNEFVDLLCKQVTWEIKWNFAAPNFSKIDEYVKENFEKIKNNLRDLTPIITKHFKEKQFYKPIHDLMIQLHSIMILIRSKKMVNGSENNINEIYNPFNNIPDKQESKRLGSLWLEKEGKWSAQWTRQESTRKFKGHEEKGNEKVDTKMKIFIDKNNAVTILRRGLDDKPSTDRKTLYSGKLDPKTNTLSGWAIYSGSGQEKYKWSAKIEKTEEGLTTEERNRLHFFN